MPDPVSLFQRSIDRFLTDVAEIGPDQWSSPTPCSEWDVRALVNHLTYEQLWAPHIVGGETTDAVGDRYDGDVLGDDPVASARSAARGSTEAFAAADLDATVHLSFGDFPCREYLFQMLTDAAVHGWDLATAIGHNTSIDPDVAELLVPQVIEQEEMLRASGMFADPVPVPADADDGVRLLCLLGRHPH